jgi:hypothetical protein
VINHQSGDAVISVTDLRMRYGDRDVGPDKTR